MAQDIVIGGRLHSAATGNTVAGANEILDDAKGKKQNVINQEVDNEIGTDATAGTIKGRIKELENAVGDGGSVDERIAESAAAVKSEITGEAASDYNTLGKVEDKIQAEASRAEAAEGALDAAKANKATTLEGYGITDAYTKNETYTKTEVNGLVDTPHQNYVTVPTYAALIAIDPGSTDTIYRVSNYDGSVPQVDVTKYSEYAWDGTQYVFLCVKSQIDEVFDISVYNNNATYADLAAALGTDGANVPQTLRRGGMSVKYVQSSDNKYVQYRLTSQDFSTNVANWQIENLNIIPDYVGTHTPFIVSDYTLWTSLASGVTQDGNVFTFSTGATMSSYIGVNGSAVLQKVKSFIGKKVRVELVFNVSGDYAHLTSGDLQQYNGTYTAQEKDVSGTIWKFWADLVVTSSWSHIFVRFSMSGAVDSAVLELAEVNCYLSENEDYEDSPNIELIKYVADKEIAPVKEALDVFDANLSNLVGSRTPIEVKSPQIWAQMASGASQEGNVFTFTTNANLSSYVGAVAKEVYQLVADCTGKKVRVELLYSVSGDYTHLKSGNLTPFSGTPTEQKKDISGTTWKFSCECVVADWVRFYISFYMQSAISSATLTFLGANVYYVEDEDYGENKNTKLIKSICNATYDREIKENLIYCFSKSGTDDATHFYGLKAIAKALDSITDATYNNRYRLIIDGTYHFTDPLDLTMFGDSEYSVAYCKPFVSLEGTGKDKCVIFVDIAPNSTFHDGKTWYDYQPIYISCEGEVNVSNMTIIGKNCRYTIHLERDPDRIGGVKRTIKNCNVIHLGLDGYQNAGFCHAFGTGMGYDHIWNIEDCYIESKISSSFAMHSELGYPAYRQGIVNFKNNTFKGDITFSQYPQNSEAFANFIGSNIFKDSYIAVVPMYRAGMYKLGNYMTTKIKMDNVAIPVYNNFFRGMVLRFDAVNDNQTITILTSPSVSSAFVDIIGDALDRGQYLTDECFIAENGYFRREGASNFKAFAFGSIDCDESATTGYRSLGKLLGDCSVTNKKLTLYIGGTYKTVTFSEDLSEKDNAYVLNIINTALSGYAVASVFCPARYQYPEVKGLQNVLCSESTPILRGMGVVYTNGGVRKALNSDGYIDGIAIDDFGQNQYGRIITEGSIYAYHKRGDTYCWFTTLEDSATERSIGDMLGISETDAGVFDVSATPKVLRAVGTDILKLL